MFSVLISATPMYLTPISLSGTFTAQQMFLRPWGVVCESVCSTDLIAERAADWFSFNQLISAAVEGFNFLFWLHYPKETKKSGERSTFPSNSTFILFSLHVCQAAANESEALPHV